MLRPRQSRQPAVTLCAVLSCSELLRLGVIVRSSSTIPGSCYWLVAPHCKRFLTWLEAGRKELRQMLQVRAVRLPSPPSLASLSRPSS